MKLMNERTLLLVDDESNIIRALVRLLRRDGYTILQAPSGSEGLRTLEENPQVGVILSDQRMPEMTGIEFLSKVKEHYPETVRLVLSGYTDLKTVTEAINQGAVYRFLTKPWEDDLLRKNVEEAFRHYELGRENERLTNELTCANEELALVNQQLEKRIEEKTREMMLNMHSLRISQEILENLPVAVLGIDVGDSIVIGNHKAHDLFGNRQGELVGRAARNALPEDWFNYYLGVKAGKDPGNAILSMAGSQKFEVLPGRLGKATESSGTIFVILPNS